MINSFHLASSICNGKLHVWSSACLLLHKWLQFSSFEKITSVVVGGKDEEEKVPTFVALKIAAVL